MRRRLGFTLLGLGLALVAWVGVVVVWGDPFTSLYTKHEQRSLARRLDSLESRWHATETRDRAAVETRRPLTATLAARRFGRRLRDGDPIGRILIPRIHLKMVVIQGTTEGDLEKGPGHYDGRSGFHSPLPGQGGVVAIAGHRTTYAHPFRHIDDLRPGDNVYLEMPYGTFRYRVYYHRVVLPSDWSILRRRPYEKLVLTACHPLYSASHRLAVFAHLVGESHTPNPS